MERGEKIQQVIKGRAPTLLDTKFANKLIGALNALQNIQLVNSTKNKVNYSKGGVIIEVEPSAEGISGEPIELWVCVDGEPELKTLLLEE